MKCISLAVSCIWILNLAEVCDMLVNISGVYLKVY